MLWFCCVVCTLALGQKLIFLFCKQWVSRSLVNDAAFIFWNIKNAVKYFSNNNNEVWRCQSAAPSTLSLPGGISLDGPENEFLSQHDVLRYVSNCWPVRSARGSSSKVNIAYPYITWSNNKQDLYFDQNGREPWLTFGAVWFVIAAPSGGLLFWTCVVKYNLKLRMKLKTWSIIQSKNYCKDISWDIWFFGTRYFYFAYLFYHRGLKVFDDTILGWKSDHSLFGYIKFISKINFQAQDQH